MYFYRYASMWIHLVVYKCERGGRCAVTWQRSTPCTGPPTHAIWSPLHRTENLLVSLSLVLGRIPMDMIGMKNSSDSQLLFGSICSIENLASLGAISKMII